MKISKLLCFVGRVRGGASGTWDHVFRGKCDEIRGRVEAATLQLPNHLFLRINGKIHDLNMPWDVETNTSNQFPRINVGEEVILHVWCGIQAVQILGAEEEVIFRFLLPQENFRDGSHRFVFDDMEKPQQEP